jgi:hypothetical protein
MKRSGRDLVDAILKAEDDMEAAHVQRLIVRMALKRRLPAEQDKWQAWRDQEASLSQSIQRSKEEQITLAWALHHQVPSLAESTRRKLEERREAARRLHEQELVQQWIANQQRKDAQLTDARKQTLHWLEAQHGMPDFPDGQSFPSMKPPQCRPLPDLQPTDIVAGEATIPEMWRFVMLRAWKAHAHAEEVAEAIRLGKTEAEDLVTLALDLAWHTELRKWQKPMYLKKRIADARRKATGGIEKTREDEVAELPGFLQRFWAYAQRIGCTPARLKTIWKHIEDRSVVDCHEYPAFWKEDQEAERQRVIANNIRLGGLDDARPEAFSYRSGGSHRKSKGI